MTGTDSVFISLIRHGETQANVEDRWQGQGDSPLSVDGEAQILSVAGRFRSQPVALVRASDLGRTQRTAQAIAGAAQAPLESEPRLRELSIGLLEGLTRRDAAARFPAALEQMKHPSEKIGGGESWMDLSARSKEAFWAMARDLASGEHGLLVTHGGTITALMYALFDLKRATHPPTLGHLTNASVTRLQVCRATRSAKMESFNDHTHIVRASQYTDRRKREGASVVHADGTDGAGLSLTDFDTHIERIRQTDGSEVSVQVDPSALAHFCKRRFAPFAGRPRKAQLVVASEGITLASIAD